jgi:hypothetical protein
MVKVIKSMTVRVIGYAPHESVLDLEDYEDFPVGMAMPLEEFKAGLDLGVYPAGLLVMIQGGTPGVVRGVYGNERIEVVNG